MRSNNFMLDGAILQDNNGGSTANFSGRTLGLDGIQEYRIIASSFSAEYDLLAGSQTVIVSKAGPINSMEACLNICGTTLWTLPTTSIARPSQIIFGVCQLTGGTITAAH